MSLTELFVDPRINEIIKGISFENRTELDLVKSELFLILCEGRKVESIPTYKEQVYYITKIVKNQIQSNTSPFHKTWRNQGQTKRFKTLSIDNNYKYHNPYSQDKESGLLKDILKEEESNEEPKHQTIIDRISIILNKDIPWYDASLFRLYYLPYDDPHCEKKVYSFRALERMHTSGNYKIDHIAIYLRVRKVFTLILTKLKEEGLLTEHDVKNLKTQKLFKSI